MAWTVLASAFSLVILALGGHYALLHGLDLCSEGGGLVGREQLAAENDWDAASAKPSV